MEKFNYYIMRENRSALLVGQSFGTELITIMTFGQLHNIFNNMFPDVVEI